MNLNKRQIEMEVESKCRLVYSYGYGSEYKESSLKELNAIQRVITVDEELDLVDLMNSRHGLNLWKV